MASEKLQSATSSATDNSPGSGGKSAGTAGESTAELDFDAKLDLPKQPIRDKEPQARVDGAADALRTALAQATAANDSTELCKTFEPLNKAMTNLLRVSAPNGVDSQVFSSQRSAVLQLFDGASSWCDSPQNVGVDTLQGLMSDIRTQFKGMRNLIVPRACWPPACRPLVFAV